MKFWLSAVLVLTIQLAVAQIDEERMKRDIEVAENVLSTLIKNELSKTHAFFGLEVEGTYQPGYGVTLRVPSDYSAPFVISTGGQRGAAVYSYGEVPVAVDVQGVTERRDQQEAIALRRVVETRTSEAMDSARTEYNKRVVKAAQDFIVDYGDFISQLAPNEKIIVTNRSYNRYHLFRNKRTHIQVEGTKGDVTAFRQGKLTREQMLGKLTVVNTETVDERDKDLELLTSIFDRLYRADLSTTFFTDGNLYYERLKDYGAVVYMQVYSSRGVEEVRVMPTLGNLQLTEEERNKKVVELYPKFERELIENILEYGRRMQTLKPEETLVFNVMLTKCQGCGIPSTLEVSVSGAVLKDYDAGKMDRSAAISKFSVKKGPKQ